MLPNWHRHSPFQYCPCIIQLKEAGDLQLFRWRDGRSCPASPTSARTLFLSTNPLNAASGSFSFGSVGPIPAASGTRASSQLWVWGQRRCSCENTPCCRWRNVRRTSCWKFWCRGLWRGGIHNARCCPRFGSAFCGPSTPAMGAFCEGCLEKSPGPVAAVAPKLPAPAFTRKHGPSRRHTQRGIR